MEVILPRSDLQLVLDGVHCSAISAISACYQCCSAIRALGKPCEARACMGPFLWYKVSKNSKIMLVERTKKFDFSDISGNAVTLPPKVHSFCQCNQCIQCLQCYQCIQCIQPTQSFRGRITSLSKITYMQLS